MLISHHAPNAPTPVANGRWCRECGYDLAGIEVDGPCPECGHVSPAELAGLSPYAAWARAVAAGLVLLLWLTLSAVSSVLIQPFTVEYAGGTAPALNMPGPKLWAVPLLQRPVGRGPEEPGVDGTRTGMLSLLAIWLITTPCGALRMRRDQALRRLTRWVSVFAFGCAFGLLMALHGLWPGQLPKYRLLLVASVELPATTLLYLYLRRLANHVPGERRRRSFDRLAWFVPLIILAAAVMLAAQCFDEQQQTLRRGGLALVAFYGTAAVLCGVLASAAVGSLAVTFSAIAFPHARRWAGAGRLMVRRLKAIAAIERGDAQRFSIALGLVTLIVVMVIGNDKIFWLSSRGGIGGNMPLINFPGPKVWAAAVVSDPVYSLSPNALPGRATLLTLNVIAVWLVTTRVDDRGEETIRRWARWGCVIAMGAAIGAVTALPRGAGPMDIYQKDRSGLFTVMTVLAELPPTLLLYALLHQLALHFDRPGLARQFRWIAMMIIAIFVLSLLALIVPRRWVYLRSSYAVLALSAAFGVIAIASAVWATTAVLALARAAAYHRRDVRYNGSPAFVTQ